MDNKYFNSKSVELRRSQIKPASYNPRTISDEGRKQLKEKDVEEIRVLLAAGNTGISIAKKYGISASAVSSIKRDKAWKIV